MGCLFALLAGFAPRIALVLVWIFTNLVDRAFHGFLIPLLGLLLFNTLDLVKALASLGQAGQRRKLDSAAALTVPYGIPIALGALIWWFGKGVRL